MDFVSFFWISMTSSSSPTSSMSRTSFTSMGGCSLIFSFFRFTRELDIFSSSGLRLYIKDTKKSRGVSNGPAALAHFPADQVLHPATELRVHFLVDLLREIPRLNTRVMNISCITELSRPASQSAPKPVRDCRSQIPRQVSENLFPVRADDARWRPKVDPLVLRRLRARGMDGHDDLVEASCNVRPKSWGSAPLTRWLGHLFFCGPGHALQFPIDFGGKALDIHTYKSGWFYGAKEHYGLIFARTVRLSIFTNASHARNASKNSCAV